MSFVLGGGSNYQQRQNPNQNNRLPDPTSLLNLGGGNRGGNNYNSNNNYGGNQFNNQNQYNNPYQ